MPKKIDIQIREELSYLENLLVKTTSSLQRDRLKTLIYIKKGKYFYQSDIGKKLGRMEKTIRTWLQDYTKRGLSSLLEVKSGGNNTRTISDRMILEHKMNDSTTTITSYVELLHILKEELGEEIQYTALYSHCRRNYKSKLKVARKSHYKKDENAITFFKNS